MILLQTYRFQSIPLSVNVIHSFIDASSKVHPTFSVGLHRTVLLSSCFFFDVHGHVASYWLILLCSTKILCFVPQFTLICIVLFPGNLKWTVERRYYRLMPPGQGLSKSHIILYSFYLRQRLFFFFNSNCLTNPRLEVLVKWFQGYVFACVWKGFFFLNCLLLGRVERWFSCFLFISFTLTGS